MDHIKCGISCNFDQNLLSTALPLFEKGEIDALEWSFDVLYNIKVIPPWFYELLEAFGTENSLIGHGVYFSVFSGAWSPAQEKWLSHLHDLSNTFTFDHITEHFGFMTGQDFHKGAPLGIPLTEDLKRMGQDRLTRIHKASRVPVGLENLAFAYSLNEVKHQGVFLKEVLSPMNGFLILDLHNVYCQVKNFNVSFEDIIDTYPLDIVREIHISGGSWLPSIIKPDIFVRRDTHDDGVPDEVFYYLKNVLPQVPNLKFVILEQIGSHLSTKQQRDRYSKDFLTMKSLCREQSRKIVNHFIPPKDLLLYPKPIESPILAFEQQSLTKIFEESLTLDEVKARLQNSILQNSSWQIENWDDVMMETAFLIAQKWKTGFN